MLASSVIQIIGLVLDIGGFCYLVWEVGFSHRLEILSNLGKAIAEPDIDDLRAKADSYRATKLEQLIAIKKQKPPRWKSWLAETIIFRQIDRRYARIEKEKSSYLERLRLASIPRSEAITKRRIALMKGASFVIVGFLCQLIGAIINLFNISS